MSISPMPPRLRVAPACASVLACALLFGAPAFSTAQPAATPPAPAVHEPDPDATRSADRLRARVEERWRVVPLRDGLLLVPRQSGRSVRGVELGRQSLAVDGREVGAAELAEALGREAEPVLALAAMTPEARTALFSARSDGRDSRADRWREAARARQDALDGREWRWRHHARVRIGSDLEIGADERVSDAVVVILGSVRVLGRVDGEVVAVGGDVHFGPTAVVQGDVTAVGGRVTMDEGARLFGHANEVTVDVPAAWARLPAIAAPGTGWRLDEGRLSSWSLGLTLWRVALVAILGLAITLVAHRRVGAVRSAIGEAPVQALVIGVGAHIVFVPALLVLAGALLVSVLGIPLLALLPLVVLAAGLYGVVGLAAVFEGLGRRLLGGVGGERDNPVAAYFLGAILVFFLTLLARVAWWTGWVAWPGAVALGVLGLAVELTAWTLGVGGVIFAWLGRVRTPHPVVVVPPPVPQS